MLVYETVLVAHLRFGDNILQRQQGGVLGPSEGTNVVPYVGPLSLRQAEHEETFHQAFPAFNDQREQCFYMSYDMCVLSYVVYEYKRRPARRSKTYRRGKRAPGNIIDGSSLLC